MSLFDYAAPAVDTTEVQAGGAAEASWNDAIGGSVVGAATSALHSFYNTAASGANFLGANVEMLDTYNTLDGMDHGWAEYYKNNQKAIDIAGFVAGSLVPGMAGIKALNLARSGASVGPVGRALGFAQTRQAANLSAALGDMAIEGGTIFTQINRNKAAAMAWGAADQVLQGAAFETAVALTMKQSPMLADDSWWDIGKSALVGAAFGGVIGGGIDALILNKGFKDAVTQLSAKQRGYDYIANLDKFNLAQGDKAYAILDSLTALPDSVFAADRTLDLAFHVGRPDKVTGAFSDLATRKTMVNLDISKVLETTLSGAQKKAMTSLEGAVADLAVDPTVRPILASKVIGDLTSMRAAGMAPELVRERMGDWLFELKKVRAATDEVKYGPEDLWYFREKFTPEEIAGFKTTEDYSRASVSQSPFPENAYKNPYVFVGTVEQRQQAFANAGVIGHPDMEGGYPTLTAAWKDGKDVAFMADGTIRVNDNSKLWQRLKQDPVKNPNQFINTRTGAFTSDAVLTAADKLAPKSVMSFTPTGVRLPQRDAPEIFLRMEKFDEKGSTEYFTARHAWASQLSDQQLPTTVRVDDFSLLDRFRSVQGESLENTKLLRPDGTEMGKLSDFSLNDVIRNSKLSEAQRLFSEAGEAGKVVDFREVAYRLNTDAKWLEETVAMRFKNAMAGGEVLSAGSSPGLSLPLDIYTRRENLVAEYARPQQFSAQDTIFPEMSWQEKKNRILNGAYNNGGTFVTGEVAWGGRVRAAQQVNRNAAGAVLGGEKASQLLDLAQDASKLANDLGSGSSSFGSSNANYGDLLPLWAQDTGKKAHLWVQQEQAKVMDQFGPVALALKTDRQAAAEVGVLTNMLRGTDEKYVWAGEKQWMLRELQGLSGEKLTAALETVNATGRKAYVDLQSDVAARFFRTHTDINADRVDRRRVLNNARGVTSNFDGNTVYAPPIDTTYFQHFAFVRPVDKKAFGTSEVTMVFGRDAAELSRRVAAIDHNQFDVISKRGTEEWFKAKDLYDFSRVINEPQINSALKRSGALTNVFPEVRAENIAEDYIRWHQNQSGRLIRDAIETHYAQQFAEIKGLGRDYSDLATSRFAGSGKTSTEITNPYDDYLKTALDISKRSEYQFLHQANEFVDALGVRAYRTLSTFFDQGKKGLIPWTEVNAIAEKHGIKGMYENSDQYFLSNVPRDRNLIKEGITKANMLLANTILRLDFFNSALNVISTPLLASTELASLRTALKNDPASLGKLGEALSIAVPGGNGLRVPSTAGLIAKAIANFFGPEKQALLARYKANGDVRETLDQFHSMLDSLSMRSDYKVFSDGVTKAFETGAKFTGNNLAEEMTRFISADIMRQLTEPAVQAGKLSLKEQNAFISVYTNRVQGNYISSQRPIVFQGVLGSAVSLFQTYSFNLMQQLLRHVGNKDKRAVATMFGMQAGLFGLNGTPFFEAVNTHLIGNAAVNQGHHDAYSVAPALFGKEVGDWMMYGTASAFPLFSNNAPALYTRGDINPRHMTILPINPLDIPAVSASIKVASNIADMGKKMLGGADLGPTLLQGLEHNGVNRPLAGLAQVMAGQATTSKGGLISAANDFSAISTAARVLGSRPMDEAVAVNNLYRMKAYEVADRERIEFLGEKVKTYLGRNQFPPDDVMDGFMKDYAKSGGRLENFQASLQRWSKDANQSVVEKMRGKLQSSYGQRLSEIMGGTPLPDYMLAAQEQQEKEE